MRHKRPKGERSTFLCAEAFCKSLICAVVRQNQKHFVLSLIFSAGQVNHACFIERLQQNQEDHKELFISTVKYLSYLHA